MKVKELKAILEHADGEMEVIISSDAEGNSFKPLAEADLNSIYIPTTEWYGEVMNAEWTSEEADMTDDDWEEMKKRDRSLVLFP